MPENDIAEEIKALIGARNRPILAFHPAEAGEVRRFHQAIVSLGQDIPNLVKGPMNMTSYNGTIGGRRAPTLRAGVSRRMGMVRP